MVKLVEISFIEPNKLLCFFDNDEERLLDLATTIYDQYAEKILSNKEVFRSAQIGEYGEIFWPDIAEITGLTGEKERCNYDISPGFAYANSILINKSARKSV